MKEEKIIQYLEGELSAEATAAVEQKMAADATFAEEVKAVKKELATVTTIIGRIISRSK